MEEVKSYTEKRGDDDYTGTALFTAGTALLAACLKRTIVVFFALKQWHLWVFLLLNLLLLAILCTSAFSAPCRRSHGNKHGARTSTHKDASKKRKNIRSGRLPPPTAINHRREDTEMKDCGAAADSPRAEPVEDSELSDDELNERVESFIASFRKQLVLDARR
ncbi:hypothetical protein SAY87_007190 [Trapa incisa]|uniref:Transmembrane protein n=2 Tax=Trapa TaxID=22665 RepID=A0AAN7QR83_TRANT|nr:hypothetical protein SAY87_007190 [Trapa incisa]KAK4774496.1 hypothetical protein SAY86_009431 [Trapa natans]